jgi:hypothetical protein
MGKELSEQAMKNLIKLMAKQIPKYENVAKTDALINSKRDRKP